MIRRALWLGTGFGLGCAAAVRARRRLDQLGPDHVGVRVRDAVGAAVADGRAEARRREAALRTVLAAPGARNPEQ